MNFFTLLSFFPNILHLIQCEATLDNLDLVDAEMLRKIAKKKSPTAVLDPVPSSFFKNVFNSVSEEVLIIINHSLQLGVFPTAFKTAPVKLLLKKSTQDTSTHSHYRPILHF